MKGVSTAAKKFNKINENIIINEKITVSSLLKTFLNKLLICSNIFHII